MNAENLTTTAGNDQFYPTPASLIDKMYFKVKDFERIKSILEPSAGDGAIIKHLSSKARRFGRTSEGLIIDCVEIEPVLQQTLRYKFGGAYKSKLNERIRELEKKKEWQQETREYGKLTEKEADELRGLLLEREALGTKVHLVYDDFLKFETYKQYDLIIMNPPFRDGDKHLLKAIEMQSRGGQIVCLLNAETLRNPYSNTRKLLIRKLSEWEAAVEYLTGEFATSETERKTDVEIALVYINVTPEKAIVDDSEIFETMRKAREEKEEQEARETGIIPHKNSIEQMVDNYNLEVDATIKFIREYRAFVKKIPHTLITEKYPTRGAILKLVVGTYEEEKHEVNINGYLKTVRAKYWAALFHNEEFTAVLTSNLLDEFRGKIDDMAEFDFSLFNIKSVQLELSQSMVTGVEKTILALFDGLSHKHYYYDETSNNIHYFNGWKTNKAWKVNHKVIVPLDLSITPSYRYDDDGRKDYKYIGGRGLKNLKDMEKVFNYLGSDNENDIDMTEALNKAAEANQTSKIQLKYFTITFYKKGTCHIVFTDTKALDKFNIFGCQRKGWLPPNYGRAKYSDMTTDEQAVVDDFQGADKYGEVLNNRGYYIDDTPGLLMLGGAQNA